MDTAKIIGFNIKKYRNALGFKQEVLAACLDVSREQISNYERGEREIPLLSLEKIANLFGIELEELLEKRDSVRDVKLSFAFRSDSTSEDIKEIANFKKVVLNYLKIEKLINEL